MSANLCSNDTINALVTYWERSCFDRCIQPESHLINAFFFADTLLGVQFNDQPAQHVTANFLKSHDTVADGVFQILLDQNILSLKYRYPNGPDMWSAAESYKYTPSRSVNLWCNPSMPTHGKLVGLLRGYSCQSCEHPDWHYSVAYQIIDQIIYALLFDLEKRDCPNQYNTNSDNLNCSTWSDFAEPTQVK
jgi:hypothetical protein